MPDSAVTLLLEFEAQVRRDQAHSPAFLHRRDRRFALECREKALVPSPRLWLEHLNRLNGPETDRQARMPLRRWRGITGGFAVAGALLGILAMTGLLFYEGGQRINLTVILAFVLLQALLALFTSAQSLAGWQPWHWLLRRLAEERSGTALRELQPQLMARAAHSGGLSFGLTGLLTLLLLVVVQDLAFGWSTTLNTGAQAYHSLLQAVAWPWHTLWPAAAPDLQLVEQTRFFRSGEGAGSIDPARWGEWWPFVTMLWLFYVIVPRLLLLLFSLLHLHYRARALLARHPGLTALYYRMETPALDTGAGHHDAADQPDTRTFSALQPLPPSRTVIRWAGAGEPQLPGALLEDKPLLLAAGGRATLEEDRAAIEAARRRLAEERAPAVWLLTRGWEPPTGELADFIEQARQSWPADTRIALLPLAPEPRRPLAQHQLEQWLRFAERSGNPLLQVSLPEPGGEEHDE
jgi:hypothetical protein